MTLGRRERSGGRGKGLWGKRFRCGKWKSRAGGGARGGSGGDGGGLPKRAGGRGNQEGARLLGTLGFKGRIKTTLTKRTGPQKNAGEDN